MFLSIAVAINKNMSIQLKGFPYPFLILSSSVFQIPNSSWKANPGASTGRQSAQQQDNSGVPIVGIFLIWSFAHQNVLGFVQSDYNRNWSFVWSIGNLIKCIQSGLELNSQLYSPFPLYIWTVILIDQAPARWFQRASIFPRIGMSFVLTTLQSFIL